MKRGVFVLWLLWCSGCGQEVYVATTPCTPIPSEVAAFAKNQQYADFLDAFYPLGYPGLVLAVRDSLGRMWMGARGYAVIETGQKLLSCHLHHSASVSKTYIATTVLLLQQKGLLEIDDPLSEHVRFSLPIENFECVTIRQLLGHQSGIFDFDTNPQIFVDYLNDPFQVDDWRGLIQRYVEGKEAYFPCGQGVRYSDTNYLLLGALIEEVTGKPLGEVVRDELLLPQDLTETYYKADTAYPDIPAATNNYFYYTDGKLQNCTDWQQHFADISMGHEGVIASPADYLRFLDLLLREDLLPGEVVREMSTFLPADDSAISLGLGLERIDTPHGPVIGHTGGGFGTMTLLLQEPTTRITFFMGAPVGSIFESEAGELFYRDLLYELVRIVKE